jgi:hypothetical protein
LPYLTLGGPLAAGSHSHPSALAALPYSLSHPPKPSPPAALTTPSVPARTDDAISATEDLEVGAADSGADSGADPRAEKIMRMRKLLGAADKRLAQAHDELQQRDVQIQLLMARIEEMARGGPSR